MTLNSPHSRSFTKPIESFSEVRIEEVCSWEPYIALRDKDFEDFQSFYQGMDPMEAIEKYDFDYLYKVSPDKEFIYALDKMGKIAFVYYRSDYFEFDP